VDFSTGIRNPKGISLGDLDGDGKLEMAITARLGYVLVYRNTATVGSITSSSFAAFLPYSPAGYDPRGISIADLDGDGKLDMALSNETSGSVSVFRNTSTSGNIGFQNSMDFANGLQWGSIAIGDLDGDGKLDMAVTNISNSISASVYRNNTSTSGTLNSSSFAAKVDFGSQLGANSSGISLGDIDGDGKIDLVITNQNSNSVSVFKNIGTPAPIITSFTPTTASRLTEITINGANFNDVTDVKFGGTAVISFTVQSSTLIKAIVDIGSTGTIAVTNIGGVGISSSIFTFISVPKITNITPLSGPIGTTVTIKGTNFSSTIANNTLWFGGVKANIISATDTTLTTTVPAGATHAPIRVLVNGKIAESPKAFNIRFLGGSISALRTSPNVDFISGNNPNGVCLGDIDGDGKLDMVVTNYNSKTISVFRNTSLSGILNSSSFATKVDFTTCNSPGLTTLGDIDGDGKLDMAVINSDSVSIYRNTSISGNINSSSFANKVDFAIGNYCLGISLGDLDLDGKLDMVITNYNSNKISVFRNTSVTRNITTSSFATQVNFATENFPNNVSLGDIDGDGKLDIAITCSGTSILSIYRNTGGSGTTGFASKVDFYNGKNAISLGDMDDDGKLDMITVSNYDIFTHKNTSTTNNISFNTWWGDSFNASASNISLGDMDGDGKLDIVVGRTDSCAGSIYKNYYDTSLYYNGRFEPKVNFGFGFPTNGISLGDMDGDGKLDIVSTNPSSNAVSVYRNISNPIGPIITSFTPTTGGTLTTVNIIGSNFLGVNSVKIGGTAVLSYTVNSPISITAVVANGTTGNLSITNNDGTATSTSLFTYIPTPTITNIFPISGSVGTVVTITGTNFSSTSINNTIWFGGVKANVITASSNSLSVIVPVGATHSPISVSVNGKIAEWPKEFKITFTGGLISNASFDSKIDFVNGNGPDRISLGDTDGDGKIDMVVTNNGSNNILSVYRNTSINGSLNLSSFATKADFSTSGTQNGIVLGDLDGDGKLDIIVTNYTFNTLSIYRNTSTIGNINFATRVDFVTETGPDKIHLGDLDGDGRLDMVVTNKVAKTISIFNNLSTIGNINYTSFSKVLTLTPSIVALPYYYMAALFDVALNDLNGDGKLDIAVTYGDFKFSNQYYSLKTFKNTSTFGSFNFVKSIEFGYMGTQEISITLGDIDGDGKQDMAITNVGQDLISIYRNTSTIDSIIFVSKVDFQTQFGTTISKVKFGDLDGDGKLDMAVNTTNGVTLFKNTSTIGSLSFTISKVTLSIPLKDISLGDLDGDGKLDLTLTNSNAISVLRYIGIPSSTITTFTPTSASSGANVIITGTNFTGATNVKFGGINATSFTVLSATSITAVVGSGATGIITVTTPGGNVTSTSIFTFISITAPALSTNAIINITSSAATSGGNISSDGGGAIISKGVCWSTSSNPTTSNSKTNDGTGAGVYTSNITTVNPNTLYYVRAYATNSVGTAYGNQVSFTSGSTSIAQKIKEDNYISLFPNPSNGKMFLKADFNKNDLIEINAMNILGDCYKIKYNFVENGLLELNIPDYITGIITLEITINGKSSFEKVTIMK
jgi:hypothetical protein